MTIFYFTPNIDWEQVRDTFGEDFTNPDAMSKEYCKKLHTFLNREQGETMFEFTPEAFEDTFNRGFISDEGYIRIFA